MGFRRIAEGIAKFIAEDEILHDNGHVSVVVEDKGDFSFQILEAIGSLGVCVTIAVTGFRRVDRSPIPQGTLEFEISCYEHPTLNRDDPSTLTAQGVMERLVGILHYRRFDFMPNQLIFKDFRRDDTDEANVVRGNFETNTLLAFGERKVESNGNTNN